MPLAHSVFKQSVDNVSAHHSATHDQNLLQNDTIALLMNT